MATSTESMIGAEDENTDTCEIEATVATGFEQTAKEEFEEKLHTKARAARGKVVGRVPIKDIKHVLELGCVDHIRVVMTSWNDIDFPKDELESMRRLRNLVYDVDWDKGLTVWKQIYSFQHPIRHTPVSNDVVLNEPFLVPDEKRMKRGNQKGNSAEGRGRGRRGDKHEKFGRKAKKEKDWKKLKEEKKERKRLQAENAGGGDGPPSNMVFVSNEGQHVKGHPNFSHGHSDFVQGQPDIPQDQNVMQGQSEIVPHQDYQGYVEHQFSDADSDQDKAVGHFGKHTEKNHTETQNIAPTVNIQEQVIDLSMGVTEICLETSVDETFVTENKINEEIPMEVNVSTMTESGRSKPQDKHSISSSPEKSSCGFEQDASPVKSSSVDPIEFEASPQSSMASEIVSQVLDKVFTDKECLSNASQAKNQAGTVVEQIIEEVLETVPFEEKSKNQSEETESQTSPVKSPKKEHNPLMPSFRITCNRSGDYHSFDSLSASSNFGGAVNEYFGWNVDLENFNIEVILNIDSSDVSVCIGLTKESLHKRNISWHGATTLRPTIACNMLRMCKIQTGDIVCDPMCGTGSIPIQGARGWPQAYHIAGENFMKAVDITMHNVHNLNEDFHAKNKPSITVDAAYWDVTRLPFKDKSIDVFITDLPFGKRMGSRMSNQRLYPNALMEMARVCRPGTGRVCLITEDRKCAMKTIQTLGRFWQRRLTLCVNLGGLAAGVYLLNRTFAPIFRPGQEEAEESFEKFRERRAAACRDVRLDMPKDPRMGPGFQVIRHTLNSSKKEEIIPETGSSSEHDMKTVKGDNSGKDGTE